jgi:2-alkenal reductase
MSQRIALVGIVFLAMMLAFIAGTAVISTQASPRVTYLQQTEPIAQPTYTTTDEQLLNALYNNVAPSVVLIYADVRSPDGRSGGATGSGFVIDSEGRIITNYHVIEGASQIEVNFFDGRIARAEVVGLDPDSDLAVIQVSDVPVESLRPLVLGDSNTLFVGQEVIAIGAPFNQAWTMTTGIVSALDRSILGLTNFSIGSAIQTDAAINPGNSGGPLLNLRGEVIGVNSQIISRSNSSSGVGFAIPSNLVGRVAEELVADGSVDYSYLGISGGQINLNVIESLNLPNDTRGVFVSGVEPNSPADAAGLRNPAGTQNRLTSADIIVAIDGEQMGGMPDLISYLASSTSPGQSVTLTVLRDGRLVDLQVTLSNRP